MTTVIGIFNTDSDLEVALNRLYDKGFNDVRVVDVGQRDAVEPNIPAGAFVPAVGPNNTAPSGTVPVIPAALFVPGFVGANYDTLNSDFVKANLDLPLSDEEATFYTEALRNGGKLLVVNTDDDHSDMVRSVMRNSSASQFTQAQ